MKNKSFGFIKIGCPGISSLDEIVPTFTSEVTVEKAGVAYANGKNYEYQVENPKENTDEFVAKDYLQGTLGLSDRQRINFDSYAYVEDNIRRGRLKVVPTMGMTHGLQAWENRNSNGYHKIEAGDHVKYSRINKLMTGDRNVKGGILNQAGFQRIRIHKGSFVAHGGRIPSDSGSYVFSHHRRMLSHYGLYLEENLTFLMYALNNQETIKLGKAFLDKFFWEEWKKGALVGDKLSDAYTLKVDEDVNNAATRAAGQLNHEIKLNMVDTVENPVFILSKNGVTESLL